MKPSISSPTSTPLHLSFGSVMIGREFVGDTVGKYRFGFNGKEKIDEVSGDGNGVDFGARVYNGRLGRWLSVDPLTSKFSYESPFVYVSNDPLIYIDRNGESKWVVFREINEQTGETTEIRVLEDKDVLLAIKVQVSTTLSNGDWTIEYDYYDINEVHTTIISEDGTKTVKPVTTEKGELRAHTLFKSQVFANILKKENIFEDRAEEGLTGIRWTTNKEGQEGQGNSRDLKNRKFIRSEYLDNLLGVLKFAKSAGSGVPKEIRSIKDALEKIRSIKTIYDGTKTILGLKKMIEKQQRYSDKGYGCASCKEARHDSLDYKDKSGNVMDAKTGDTLTKAKR